MFGCLFLRPHKRYCQVQMFSWPGDDFARVYARVYIYICRYRYILIEEDSKLHNVSSSEGIWKLEVPKFIVLAWMVVCKKVISIIHFKTEDKVLAFPTIHVRRQCRNSRVPFSSLTNDSCFMAEDFSAMDLTWVASAHATLRLETCLS